MPLPTIANTCRVQVRGTCESGQRWMNVLHLQKVAGPWASGDYPTVDALIDRLYSGTAWAPGTNLLTNCAAGVTFDDVTYLPLDGSSASVVLAHNKVGSQSGGSSQPSELAAVVTLRSDFRGRSHRGRVYLPPTYTGARAASGFIGSGYITATLGQFNGFRTALVSAGFDHVIASYKLSAITPISSYTMDNKFDVQRGRK